MKVYIWGVILLAGWGVSGQTAAPAGKNASGSFAQRLYGTWYTYPLGNPNTDPVRHEFRHNPATGKDEMIVTRLCPGDYRSTIAKAVSPIEVSETTITVLKSATTTEKDVTNAECTATINSGMWTYELSADGNSISATNPGGVPDIFQLARQDASSAAVMASPLYGSWLLPLQEEHGAKVQIRLVFYSRAETNRGMVRQICVCSKGTNSVVSQADAEISISKSQITILQGASHEQRDGPFTCTASIAPGTLRYVVSPNGATMKLSKPGQPPMTLTRERAAQP